MFRGKMLLAASTQAKVMDETRLSPVVSLPRDDLSVDASNRSVLTTFCPFKGAASDNQLMGRVKPSTPEHVHDE